MDVRGNKLSVTVARKNPNPAPLWLVIWTLPGVLPMELEEALEVMIFLLAPGIE